MLCDRLSLSERRACQIAGQHRSTQRHEPTQAQDDAALRARLRELSRDRPRWGYRRAHAAMLEEGWRLNRKRVQRIWREEGLRVPSAAESASASESRLYRPIGCGPSAPTRCGRSTSSSTRPQTAGS